MTRSFLSLILLISLEASGQTPDYRELHSQAVVVDLHNDAPQRLVHGENLALRTRDGHTDLPRLREGGVDVVWLSIWVPPSQNEAAYFGEANAQIDSVLGFVRRNQGEVGLARSSGDIDSLVRRGKIAIMMGLEGAHPMMDNIDNLDYFYQRGIRYVTLTWNNSTSWASSAKDEYEKKRRSGKYGLSPLGAQFIRRMNELGMIIDVSHAGETTFDDVLNISAAPIIASHSSVYSLCPHWRNLTDRQMQKLAASGGAIFINFAPFFIDSSYAARVDSARRAREHLPDSARGETGEMLRKIRPPAEVVIDHIAHVGRLVGFDHVGLGSDFDGIGTTPEGLEDVSCYPEITSMLMRRGIGRDDVLNVLGGSFIKVLKAVESMKK